MAGSARAARATKPIAIRLMGRRFICSRPDHHVQQEHADRATLHHYCAENHGLCRRKATSCGIGVWLRARRPPLWGNLPYWAVIVFFAPNGRVVDGAILVEGNTAPAASLHRTSCCRPCG